MARGARKSEKGQRLVTPQSVDAVVKSICDIMRRSNCAGALQYVPELTWILFLRILDEREAREQEQAEAVGADFSPSLDLPFRWRDGGVGRVARFDGEEAIGICPLTLPSPPLGERELQNARATCRFSRIRQSPSRSPHRQRRPNRCTHYDG
jgi:hypothetical protein